MKNTHATCVTGIFRLDDSPKATKKYEKKYSTFKSLFCVALCLFGGVIGCRRRWWCSLFCCMAHRGLFVVCGVLRTQQHAAVKQQTPFRWSWPMSIYLLFRSSSVQQFPCDCFYLANSLHIIVFGFCWNFSHQAMIFQFSKLCRHSIFSRNYVSIPSKTKQKFNRSFYRWFGIKSNIRQSND